MFGKVFFNRTFRNYINSFGTLFNDITIGKYNSNGTIAKKIKVPIVYSSKEQWYSNLKQQDDIDAAMTLPIITYIQSGLTRKDDTRKAQRSEKVLLENEIYAVEYPQEWEMNMKLSIVTGSQMDMDQILEQIMYYFDPSFTIKIILLKDTINFVHECPITLASGPTEVNNNWMGEFTRRRITYEMNFKFTILLFGPIFVDKSADLTQIPFDIIEMPKSLGEKAEKVVTDFHSGGVRGPYFNYIELQAFPRENRLTIQLEDNDIITVEEDFYDGKIRNILPDPFDVPAGSL